MPREEVFLISSFVMNLRHGASHTLDMLWHSRTLVEERASRKGRKSLHFPKIKVRKWLFSGSGEPDAFHVSERESFSRERGGDVSSEIIDAGKRNTGSLRDRKPGIAGSKLGKRWAKSRRASGKALDWIAHSDSFLYAVKFTVGVMLVAWPAFVLKWVEWYSMIRGGAYTPLPSPSPIDVVVLKSSSLGAIGFHPCL